MGLFFFFFWPWFWLSPETGPGDLKKRGLFHFPYPYSRCSSSLLFLFLLFRNANKKSENLNHIDSGTVKRQAIGRRRGWGKFLKPFLNSSLWKNKKKTKLEFTSSSGVAFALVGCQRRPEKVSSSLVFLLFFYRKDIEEGVKDVSSTPPPSDTFHWTVNR